MSASKLYNLANNLSGIRSEELGSSVFSKALYAFVLVKVIALYVALSPTGLASSEIPDSILHRVFFFPARVAEDNLLVFTLFVVLSVAVLLWMKVNYVGNVFFFWVVVNLYRFKFPVINGSDIVLMELSFYNIALASRPLPASKYWEAASTVIFNTARVVIQFQIILIYLISGWDKLTSPVWRSGDAFAYIPHLDVFFNPSFKGWFSSDISQKVFAWLTILFEIFFVVFLFKRSTRLFILCVGVVFHLIIWAMFHLPDFALIMILSYLIFLKDSDYVWLREKFKRQLP